MALRQKTLFAIGLTFISLSSVVYATLQVTLLRHFRNLEEANLAQRADRVAHLLAEEVEKIDFLLRDWSAWSDTYDFIVDQKTGYRSANLNDESFNRLDLNLSIYVNRQNEIIYGTGFDQQQNRKTPIPTSIYPYLTPEKLLNLPELTSVQKGFLTLPEGVMIVAARLILTSEALGPSRGTLIFGRYLSPSLLQSISNSSGLSVSIEAIPPAHALSQDVKQAFLKLNRQTRTHLLPLTDKTIANYHVIPDIEGNSTLILKVSSPRLIHQQGQAFAYYLAGSLFVLVLLSGAATVWILEKLILRRVARLKAGFAQIASTGDLNNALHLPGNDELSQLVDTCNEMLSALAHFQTRQLEMEKRYQVVVEQALEAIFLVDVNTGTIIQANAAFCQLLGHSASEIPSLTLKQIVAKRYQDLSIQNAMHEQQYVRKDGSIIDVEVSSNRIAYGQRQLLCIVAHDITDRKRFEERLRFQAFHDSLTSLPNRALLLDRLERALTLAQPQNQLVAVLLVDLDSFKVVNDSLGHGVGDQVLIALAGTLARCLRPQDTLARFGGDEFIILMESLDSSLEATRLARMVLNQLNHPIQLDDQTIYTSASIGIAIAAGYYGGSAAALVRDADTAMYRAKAEGKNRYVVFDQEMHQQALQRLEVETELRQGLERDELRLYLQPILSLPTLKLVGFETLVRWQHPKKGLLCPGHFLPVAEETGLILALDQRMIQMASEQMQQWRETNLADGLTLSINLSGRQVGHPGLTALIGRWAFYGTQDPSWLKLEITETLIMEDDDVIRETLWHLRDMGICLSIDDFGTGYSSLSRLHHYPIDTLKIDGSFVRRIGPNGEHMAMVQSIVGLAHSLGMEVVAEGVETEQHLQHLQQIRCEYGQGYYFARPLDPAAATQFIQLHQAGFKTGVVLH